MGRAEDSPKGLTRRTKTLLLRAAAAAIAVGAASFAVSRMPKARASSELGPMYGADRAIDDDEQTEWVPRTGRGEWLEIALGSRRSIHKIRLLNGHVLPDRAAREVEITAYSGGDAVGTFHTTFSGARPTGWVTLDAGAVRSDRLRILIVDAAGGGGAISEVVVN
jgi:hypothetical protein